MTEYTISSQAYREFMSARERTAYWVQQYDPVEVYSPTSAPTEIEGYVPPSPAMSTHSLPPKMVLRYNDGRGDIPIPHAMGRIPSARSSPKHRSQHHSRSGSHASSPLAAPPSHDYPHPPTPEEIHILPSRSSGNNTSSTPSSSSRRSHARSQSVPRHPIPEQSVPYIAPPVPRSRPGQPTVQHPPYPPWVPGRSGSKPPPPIVYAPGRHHGPNFEPPLLLHHQPQMGPNGMIYSHSAPPVLGGGPSHYPPRGGYPAVARTDDDRIGRSPSREYRRPTRGRQPQPLRRNGSSDSLGSQESGSTYYVLPSAGQKVHVIAASPERSIETASSTTKGPSPTSPFPQMPVKRPFFGRLFARFASPAPSKGHPPNGRKLHRRHSIGASSRPQNIVA